jgi:hypothetical protein
MTGGAEFFIDPQRTCLQERFFGVFSFDSREELLATISEMTVGVDTISQSRDSKLLVYSGWVYWFLFLKGYLEWAQAGALRDDNTYLDYILRYYGPREHDPGLADVIASPEQARERVERRFQLMAAASEVAERTNGDWQVEAVVVYAGEAPPDAELCVFPVGLDHPVVGKLVDGWHRLFVARLFDVASLPGRIVIQKEEAA